MNNHYHLLMSTPGANLSQIVRHINGAYTNYFNKRHHRIGHLLQGRYKAILVDADEYAGELSRYIHMNPVRAGIIDRPEGYSWSSYAYYIGERKSPRWLTTEWLLGYFGSKSPQKAYRKFVDAKHDITEEAPSGKAVESTILGGTDFIDEIRKKHLKNRRRDRNLPALSALTRPSMEEITKKVQMEFNEKPEQAKKAAIYLNHRFSGQPLKEIGRQFGIGESAVSQASRRFEAELESNRILRREIERIRGYLNLSKV